MMVLHELGHVLAAWATGGQVTDVVLHPLTISRTDVRPNPRPLLVAWGGAVVGCLAPLGLWLMVRIAAPRFAFLPRFFAGFCLIANGAYLAGGAFGRVGDAGDLLAHGAAVWQLVGFGLITTPIGLALWNGLGAHFGLGSANMRVDRTAVVASISIFVVLVVTMTAWGQPPPPGYSGPALTTATKRVSLGYLPGSSTLKMNELPWRRLTHVANAFLQADPQGNVTPGGGVPNQKLTAAAHLHDVRVLVSLGGGNSVTAFEKISADPERLARYVAGVVKLVEENNYDGIDLDWEFPRSTASKNGFTALANALRTALDEAAKSHTDGRRYELTAAISAGEHFGRWLDEKTLREAFDFLNVMTYDMSGPWAKYAAHHAPLKPSRRDPLRRWRSVQYAMTYWHRRRGIPKEKLCIGIPLYGRMFPVSRPHTALDPKRKEEHRAYAFADLKRLAAEGWTAHWDYESNVPWLAAPDRKAIIAFDDRNSVDAKAKWAREQGFRGMFFWAIGQDRMPGGKHWLVDAAVRAWPE
jgi:chitinase